MIRTGVFVVNAPAVGAPTTFTAEPARAALVDGKRGKHNRSRMGASVDKTGDALYLNQESGELGTTNFCSTAPLHPELSEAFRSIAVYSSSKGTVSVLMALLTEFIDLLCSTRVHITHACLPFRAAVRHCAKSLYLC